MKGRTVKPVIIAALLFTAVPPAHAQTLPYISPGLQIGYGFGEGWFFSAQVSAGIIFWNSPLVPATTIGIRKYKDQTMRYADFQLTLFADNLFVPGAPGIGFGKVWVTPDEGGGTITGLRFKLYHGLWLLGSYDAYKLPGRPIKHHLGLFLVFPLIYLGDFIYT